MLSYTQLEKESRLLQLHDQNDRKPAGATLKNSILSFYDPPV